MDMNYMAKEGGEDVYGTFNMLMRRKAKENNFKAVLESIRDLMNEDCVLPPWLHDILLGYGDPGAAQVRSAVWGCRRPGPPGSAPFVHGWHWSLLMAPDCLQRGCRSSRAKCAVVQARRLSPNAPLTQHCPAPCCAAVQAHGRLPADGGLQGHLPGRGCVRVWVGCWGVGML